MTYSNIVKLIVYESSIWVKPRRSIAHSVVRVTTIKVSPSEENPYRFKKVIKNPNPPISIIWISIITIKWRQKWLLLESLIFWFYGKKFVLFYIQITYMGIYPDSSLAPPPGFLHGSDYSYFWHLQSPHSAPALHRQRQK